MHDGLTRVYRHTRGKASILKINRAFFSLGFRTDTRIDRNFHDWHPFMRLYKAAHFITDGTLQHRRGSPDGAQA